MQDGFFHSSTLMTGKQSLSIIPECEKCRLWKSCRSPKMPVYGQGERKILIIAEAPGCISGDSRIAVAFLNKSKFPSGIPIKNLEGKKNFYVYSYDTKNQELTLGLVKKVWKTGTKKIYRVTYEWKYAKGEETIYLQNHLDVTANHKFLLKKYRYKDPFKGIYHKDDYISIEGGLSIGHSLQPFYQRCESEKYYHVGTSHNTMVREGRFLLGNKLGRKLVKGEDCHHRDENKWNDSWKNLELLTTENHARHHMEKSNPMYDLKSKEKWREKVESGEYKNKISKSMKGILSKETELYKQRVDQIHRDAPRFSKTLKKKYKDPIFYYNYLVSHFKWRSKIPYGKGSINEPDGWIERKFREKFPNEEFPPVVDNHKVISIEYMGIQDVYDMEVEEYHNFAVNGIFVHNSDEDEQGIPLVGKSGQYVRDCLTTLGIDLERDCWTTNSLICRPPQNRTPTTAEISFCRPNLTKAIRDLEPAVIIPLGGPAVQSLIGGIWKEDVGQIGRWVGWEIPCQKPNAWIFPNFHPSYVIRSEGKPDEKVIKLWFNRWLKTAVEKEGKPWPNGPPNFDDCVRIYIDPDEAARKIRRITKWALEKNKPLAFDFEADRLKPHRKGATVYSCSISNGKVSIAYPMVGNAVKATKEMIVSDVKKILSNGKYDGSFAKFVLGVNVRSFVFDTIVASHILDNRPKTKSLKFQSFVLLGQTSYDDVTKPFFKSKGSNEPNNIREIDLQTLLHYNALDSLMSYKIAMIQAKQLGIEL